MIQINSPTIQVLRSAVGIAHVLRSRPVMDYTTSQKSTRSTLALKPSVTSPYYTWLTVTMTQSLYLILLIVSILMSNQLDTLCALCQHNVNLYRESDSLKGLLISKLIGCRCLTCPSTVKAICTERKYIPIGMKIATSQDYEDIGNEKSTII